MDSIDQANEDLKLTLKQDLINEHRAKKDMWTTIIGALLIAACSGSLGYGWSQTSVSTSVIKLTQIIENMKDTQERDRRESNDRDARLMTDLQNQRSAATQHMNDAIALMTKLVEQNTALILKIQVAPK